ncbi:MAG: hypothetical protein RLZZ283_322 [Candidatus Parcubacteria bacterium]|jgi:signal peptidase I
METHEIKYTNDLVIFALIALFIVIPIRWFVAQPFIVHGASMEPTFENGEYLIVDQLTYQFEDPARGDVIIMRYPNDESTYFIKRVIGLPNETVELQGATIIIRRPDGLEPITLDETYRAADARPEFGTYTLGENEFFVMGDNRNASSDSRVWGSLPRHDVVGRALLRLFPLERIGAFPGSVKTQN